jgi:hydrogenase expression/formation protein HypC
MCLTMPGQVIALDAAGALIRCGEEEYHAAVLLIPDIAVGDYVLVQAGMILERLTPEEAAEITALIGELLASPADGEGWPGDQGLWASNVPD